MTIDLTHCPEPRCAAPASVTRRFTLDSTHGPAEHVETWCARGHRFLATVDTLFARRHSP